MGERIALRTSLYEFKPVLSRGDEEELEEIKFKEKYLFLDLSPIELVKNKDYLWWIGYCKEYRHPYVVAEGILKLKHKDRKGVKQKVYGFFRPMKGEYVMEFDNKENQEQEEPEQEESVEQNTSEGFALGQQDKQDRKEEVFEGTFSLASDDDIESESQESDFSLHEDEIGGLPAAELTLEDQKEETPVVEEEEAPQVDQVPIVSKEEVDSAKEEVVEVIEEVIDKEIKNKDKPPKKEKRFSLMNFVRENLDKDNEWLVKELIRLKESGRVFKIKRDYLQTIKQYRCVINKDNKKRTEEIF